MLENIAVSSLLIARGNNFENNNSTDKLNGYNKTFTKQHQGIHN